MGQLYSCPSQETVAVVETCGKFSHLAFPGFNCIQCYVGQAVRGHVSLRVQQLEVTCETKTRDNVFVTLVVCVQFEVRKDAVYDAFYKLTDSRQQISSYVYDVVRSSVPKMDLDSVFEEKEQIALDVKEELMKSMSNFGYDILQALVNDISPVERVKQAMNDINSAQRLRVAAVQKAEAEKIKVVKAAEAEAEGKYLQGQGIARQRQAIVNGLRESVKSFSSNVSDVAPKDVLELMLMTQYFDMLKELGANERNSTVFLPAKDALMNGNFAGDLRNAMLEAGAAQGMVR